MKELTYVLMDPTGNMTILVETPVPVEEQPAVAARLMEAEPSAEQVGFVYADDDCGVGLRMAGGEFCGNAAMSAAVLSAIVADVPEGTTLVETSLAADQVPVEYYKQPDGSWSATVDMPKPTAIKEVKLPVGGPGSETVRLPYVQFDGIAHLIYEHPAPEDDVSRADAEQLVKDWLEALDTEALGLLFFDREDSRMTPLVYVPAVGTICWETACASGAAAVGAFLAAESNAPVERALKQPGGFLQVFADPDGSVQLGGTVVYCYRKTLMMD